MRPIYVYAPITSNINPGVTQTKEYVKNKYDFEQEKGIENPLVELYHLMVHAFDTKKDDASGFIIVGGDQTIDLPIVYAANDFVSKHDSHLLHIVFDSEININEEVSTIDNTNIFTNIDKNIFNLPLINQFEQSQMIFIGHHDSPHAYNLSNLSMKKVKLFGKTTPNILMDMIKDYRTAKGIDHDSLIIHISIDANVFKHNVAPSVLNIDDKENKIERDGLELDMVLDILKALKEEYLVLSMSVSEFDPSYGNDQDNRKTVEVMRQCMIKTFDIKENKMNIVNDDTQFIVYRPLQQIDVNDVGWYILRQVDTDTKDRITKHIQMNKVTIEPIGGNDIMLSLTTTREQNAKVFHNKCKIDDIVLFSEEKKDMIFELINVPIV
jgi:arginase family enzyme